jgi:hypothetical protein
MWRKPARAASVCVLEGFDDRLTGASLTLSPSAAPLLPFNAEGANLGSN